MKKLLFIAVLVLSVITLQAQNTNTDRQSNNNSQSSVVKQQNVPPKVLNTFKQNFSSAKNPTWTKYRNYYEAYFTQDGKQYYVAIAPNGTWVQTSITGSMGDLPGTVKEQFQAGEYASYDVKNVREISTSNYDKIYMLEIASSDMSEGNNPMYLYYEPSGNLYRVGNNQFVTGSPVMRVTKAERVNREELPPLVENAFVETYPEVKDVRWHKEDNRYVAEYSDKGQRMYFVTTPEGEGIESIATYNFQQLPQPIQDAYNKAQYKDWEIYNVEYVRPAFAEDDLKSKFKIHLYKMQDNDYTFKTLTYDQNGNLLKVDQ